LKIRFIPVKNNSFFTGFFVEISMRIIASTP